MRFLALSFITLFSGAVAEPTFQIGGLRVINEPVSKDLVPFNSFEAGVSIACILSGFEKPILELDSEASTLKSLTTGSGKTLMVEGGFGGKTHEFKWPKFSKDKKTVMFEITTYAPPAKGTKELKLDADVAFLTGEKTVSTEHKGLTGKKGEKFELGGEMLTFEEAKAPDWGDWKWQWNMKGKFPASQVKEISAVDQDGKTVKAKFEQSGWSQLQGFPRIYTYRIAFERKLERADVIFQLYSDLETVKVPISTILTVGN